MYDNGMHSLNKSKAVTRGVYRPVLPRMLPVNATQGIYAETAYLHENVQGAHLSHVSGLFDALGGGVSCGRVFSGFNGSSCMLIWHCMHL